MNRLLDLLGECWEEFRGPSQSALPPACQGFVSAARASLQQATGLIQFPSRPSAEGPTKDSKAAQQAKRFVAVLEEATKPRCASRDGDVTPAIEALNLASRLVQEIPWGGLHPRALELNHDTLKWTVQRIRSLRRGWNDRRLASLVRQAARLDPKFLEDVAKESAEDG